MDGLREKYIAAIAAAQDESALEETRLAAVGKKGEVSLKPVSYTHLRAHET